MKIPLASFRDSRSRKEFIARYRDNQALWPVPWEEARIRTSYGISQVMICGDRSLPPLVLLHGFLNTPLMWRYTAEELSRHFCLYLPETLGDAGVSRYRHIALKPGHWAGWLGELLDKLSLGRVRLGGFSLGGWHAARFALERPERVEALALLSPVPLFRMVPVSLLREAVAVILAGRKPEIRRLIGKQYAAHFFPDRDYEKLQYAALTGFLPSLPLFPRELTREEWKKLPAKTLIIIGEEEIYFDPDDARKMVKKFRHDIHCVLLDETGHTVSIERPSRVNALLGDFFL